MTEEDTKRPTRQQVVGRLLMKSRACNCNCQARSCLLRTLSRWDRLLIETAALHCGYIDRYPVMAPLGRRLRLPDKEHAASADVHGRDMVRLAMTSALATLEFVPRRKDEILNINCSR